MDLTYNPGKDNRIYQWLFLAVVLVGLYFTTYVNYLLFHSIVELFSIIIAATVFILTWKSLPYIRNPYLIIVGISYLFIGVLDLLHTLAYTGMPIFTDYDYYANQLWIAARYMESVTLLVGFILLHEEKKASAGTLFTVYLFLTGLAVASIFYWKIFPVCFIPGIGLTPFKIYSEYLICGILMASMYMLHRNKNFFPEKVHKLIAFSLVFAVISELAFTIYTSNFDIANLVGHYFKLFSVLMIYQAIVVTGIEEPYDLIFKELFQANRTLQKEIEYREKIEKEREMAIESLIESEERYRVLNEELEQRVAERTAEVQQKDQQILVQGRQAAMGEMIGHIAHQWRQPLNSLGLLVQEVQLSYEYGGVDKEYLEQFVKRAMEQIQHMSQTVEDFRNFFRPGKEKVVFKVNDIIAKTLSLVQGTFKEQQVAVEVITESDPVVEGYPNEFSQVLLNILVNARDAFVERKIGKPRVVVKTGQQGDAAVVTITDNAGGIADEIRDRIFDPYFTTKGPNAGTGVGLSMAKTIIEKNMGGRLSVRNVGDGAEFRIELETSLTPLAPRERGVR